MKTERRENTYRVSVPCRTYTFDERSPFLSEVEAAGHSLLTAPVRLCCQNGEELAVFGGTRRFRLREEDEKRGGVTFSSCTESASVVVNTTVHVAEDGCMETYLSVMPRGLSVAQCFGLDGEKGERFDVRGLMLEIPLSAACLSYFHMYPLGHYVRDGETVGFDPLRGSDRLPLQEVYAGFKEQVLLLSDDCGFGFFCDSDRDFENEHTDRVTEILPQGNTVLVRIHFADHKPACFTIPEGRDNLMPHSYPLTLHFGMQALPVRAWDAGRAYERNLHIDCFKKTPGNYEDYLSRPVCEGEEEIGLDRLARLGVKVLYLHEKWNDFQNSPVLSEESSNRLRFFVRECHKRGIRVVPYFGYEISVLSPLYPQLGKQVLRRTEDADCGFHWYRYPWQRAIPVCLHSAWKDVFFEGITALQREYGFDGFYLDSTVPPEICKNEAHGCGFRRDGVLHGTYPVWDIRDLMQQLSAYCEERDLILNVHACGAVNIAAMAYCSSLWEGETFQSKLLKGELCEVPAALLQSQFTGRNTGVPVYSLCYSNPPAWCFRQAASLALLHGSFPKPVDIGEPLALMSRVWEVFDRFDLRRAVFHPYWESGESPFSVTGAPYVRISYYESDTDILAVCACCERDAADTAVVTCRYAGMTDAESGESLGDGKTASLPFCGFDFRLLYVRK